MFLQHHTAVEMLINGSGWGSLSGIEGMFQTLLGTMRNKWQLFGGFKFHTHFLVFAHYSAAACADVLHRLNPPSPGLKSQASSLISQRLLHASQRPHILWDSADSPGVTALSVFPGTARRSPAYREVWTRRPSRPTVAVHPLPSLPSTPKSNPAHCDTSRPFIKIFTEPRNSERERPPWRGQRRRITSALSSKSGSVWRAPGGPAAVDERKSYLSTERCSRIEIVGNPQHPQHRETQQYPRFPPHGCDFSPSARPCVWPSPRSARLGPLAAACPGQLCPRGQLRWAASAAFLSRQSGAEGAGSSEPPSAGLEGKGKPTLIQSNTGSGSPGGGPGPATSRALRFRANVG